MTKVALVPSEPLRPRMAGIGIRYLELARRLPAYGFKIVLVTAGDPNEVPPVSDAPSGAGNDLPSASDALSGAGNDLPSASDALSGAGYEVPPVSGAASNEGLRVEVRAFERGRLREVLAGCDAVVTQGQLANDVLLELPELPAVVDLYDPWLVENLHYHETLGLDPYRNDHATWVLQLSRGDFFLCSSEEQRSYYLGFLTAVGRVNPVRVAADPNLDGLIAPVPFGLPEELPPHEPVLEPAKPGVRRLLFGGLYDWYDPWTLLDALERLEAGGRGGWELLFVRNPNPDGTPQRLLSEVEARCRKKGWWGEKVRAVDWVPAERRYDLLRDVDLLVSPDSPSLETRLSLRTRFLDALAAGCPSICTEGGAMSRLLAQHDAGWVVPPGDAAALAEALEQVLDDPEALAQRRRNGDVLRRAFAWPRVLAPLVHFLRQPARDSTKEAFAFRPPTIAPPDSLSFRLRRWLRS